LQAYLRQAVLNQIRDAIRRAKRRPALDVLDEEMMTGQEISPFEHAVGVETLSRYDAALAALRPQDREAIIGRIELGYDYKELAMTLDKPTDGAARLAVHRALLRLAEEMRRGR